MTNNALETVEDIGLLIASVKRKMRKRMNDKLKPYGMTAEQRGIILALCRNGAMTQAQICELTSTQPSNLSMTLRRLSQNNYIRKLAHPDDPRAHLIKVTQKAFDIAVELDGLSAFSDDLLTKDIDQKSLQITIETLNKINQNL